MNEPLTLLGLLEQSGAKIGVYDVGRRVQALPRATFRAFELATLPYPLPMQHKAWVGIVQQPGAAPDEPVIWFLRLGLDEQGLLVQAERDYLLNRLLESAQARARGHDPQPLLQDNPNAFRPRAERMALFNAVLRRDLDLPPSRYYGHALNYFAGRLGWDQWGFVGYQGIADVACRHADGTLATAVPSLPREPLVALCHCLEATLPDERLSAALIDRLQTALEATPDDTALLAALLRGLSGRLHSAEVADQFDRILAHAVGRRIELLAAISGRAWELLHDAARRRVFLTRLADNDHGQAAFEQCLRDLLSVPTLAGETRATLRDPTLPDVVRAAFGRMTEPARH